MIRRFTSKSVPLLAQLRRMLPLRQRMLRLLSGPNFRGVARCIAAGLTVTELEKARAVFLKSHPGAESQSHVKFVTGNAYEQNHQMLRAVECYEEALKLDPLNLRYQQRYWGLKRKGNQ